MTYTIKTYCGRMWQRTRTDFLHVDSQGFDRRHTRTVYSDDDGRAIRTVWWIDNRLGVSYGWPMCRRFRIPLRNRRTYAMALEKEDR